MNKRKVMMLCTVWALVIICIVGALLAALNVRLVTGEQYKMIDRYSRLEEIRTILNKDYYQDIDEDVLIEGAEKGMLASLNDMYTFYYTPEEMEQRTKEDEGRYQGIGVAVLCNEEGRIEIVRVYEDSPAADAGLRAGDCIISANGVPVSGENAVTLDAAILLMDGESGTVLELGILREGAEMRFSVTRGDVTASNIDSAMLDNDIGYIAVAQFTGDAQTGFAAAIQKLQSEGARALIVDLRGNPGGLLDYVVDMCDQILPEGLIVYTMERDGSRRDYYSTSAYWDVPLVVLIDEKSASASEIMAAAVQDSERGLIIGETSYGKGIVQNMVTFKSDGAGMQYTVATYYTPSGTCIHGTGVRPDVEIADDPDTTEDECLNRAIEMISEEM